jgi:hypothetical protein
VSPSQGTRHRRTGLLIEDEADTPCENITASGDEYNERVCVDRCGRTWTEPAEADIGEAGTKRVVGFGEVCVRRGDAEKELGRCAPEVGPCSPVSPSRCRSKGSNSVAYLFSPPQ